MGCNFCTTSSFFGGKGSFVNFYETGADLFRVMCDVEARLKVSCFFMMDENFLLYRRRALELLELMKARGNVLTREFLMDHVWGYHSDAASRTLDTHVRRLREKLGQDGSRIETVRGVGYRIGE